MRIKSVSAVLVFTLILLAGQSASAFRCPTVRELKKGELGLFKAYTVDNGTEIEGDELARESQSVASFDFAQFVSGAPEGQQQCFYKPKYEGEYVLFYFAADDRTIKEPAPGKFWKKLSDLTSQCKKYITKCEF